MAARPTSSRHPDILPWPGCRTGSRFDTRASETTTTTLSSLPVLVGLIAALVTSRSLPPGAADGISLFILVFSFMLTCVVVLNRDSVHRWRPSRVQPLPPALCGCHRCMARHFYGYHDPAVAPAVVTERLGMAPGPQPWSVPRTLVVERSTARPPTDPAAGEEAHRGGEQGRRRGRGLGRGSRVSATALRHRTTQARWANQCYEQLGGRRGIWTTDQAPLFEALAALADFEVHGVDDPSGLIGQTAQALAAAGTLSDRDALAAAVSAFAPTPATPAQH